MVAAPHWGDCSLSVEKRFDEISATGGHRIFSPSTALVRGLGGRRTNRLCSKTKMWQDVKSCHIFVEHRRFELLTPTLPVLCATNCANAPNRGYIIISGSFCKAVFSVFFAYRFPLCLCRRIISEYLHQQESSLTDCDAGGFTGQDLIAHAILEIPGDHSVLQRVFRAGDPDSACRSADSQE